MLVRRSYSSEAVEDEPEENMEQLVDLGLFLGGLGVFFIGIGALYGVSVWAKKD